MNREHLQTEFYEWLVDYINKEEAAGLAIIFTNYVTKYYRYRFSLGVITGVVLTFILLKWLS